MQKTTFSRLAIAGVITILIMITGLVTVAAQAQGKTEHVLTSGIPNPTGLAMDNRCNFYTADRNTGYVFCIPPDSDPILLAKVPDTPTAVAVDRLRNVFVGTEGGSVYLVSLDGDVVEAYRCNARPMGLEIDRDGGLVIATDEGEIVKVERKAFRISK